MTFTVGYTTTPTLNSGNSYTANKSYAFGPYTMPQAGTLQSISIWLSGSPSGTMQLGVYGPSGTNQPGSLLAKTAQFSAAGGWTTVNTTTNPTIANGTVIWIGAVDTANDATVADAPAGINLLNGTLSSATLVDPFLNPDSVNTTNWATGDYATFTPLPSAAYSLPSGTFNTAGYLDNSVPARSLSLYAPVASTNVEYGETLNISSVTGNSYRDFFVPPLNLNLYTPPPPTNPFFGLALLTQFNAQAYLDKFFDGAAFLPNIIQGQVQSYLGSPFNPGSYRDSFFDGTAILPNTVQCSVQSTLGAPFDTKGYLERFHDGAAFLPTIIQGQISSYLGAPFNAGNYRDNSNYDNAFLPTTIQGQVTSYLGSPFNSQSYHDSFLDWSAFLPEIIQCNVWYQLGAPFNAISYRDTSNYDNAFLPSIIQGKIQSSLWAPFSPLSYRDSFVAPLNIGLYPPAVIANPFSLPLAAIPFNTLSYRDPYLPPTNANLYTPVAGAPFFGSASPALFNPQNYRDSRVGASAFLPNAIQGQVQSYLGGQFNPQAYRDTFFDGSAFLPNTIQGQVSAYFGAPFSALSYRDSYFDSNAFLPTVPVVPQAPFFNVSPAPFDSKSYRDYSIPLRNVNLYPPPFGTPFLSFLEENAAPFSALSYFDRYVFERSPSLFPAPSGTPFANPYPFVPFDAKRYTDTSADLKNAFLPSIIQGQVSAYFGAPFTTLSYRDTEGVRNAFLPSSIQGQVQAYFGAPFNLGAYRDTSEFQPFPPRVTQPPVGYQLGVPFSDKSYRDSAKYPPNPFLPSNIQGQVAAYFGSPFNALAYRDSEGVRSAFLPRSIQGQISSQFGVQFTARSYRDSFFFVPSPLLYPTPIIGFPFFNAWSVPFDVHAYHDDVLCPRTSVNIVSLYVGQGLSIRIALQDDFGNWLQPPFNTGWFEIELNGQTVLDLNTNDQDVRFVSFVTGQWYLQVNLGADDTQHIPIGWYSYSAFLGAFPIESGLLQMMICDVPIPVNRNYPPYPPLTISSYAPPPPPVPGLRHYPVRQLPAPVPFSNPIQNVRFNPITYIGPTIRAARLLP